MTNQQHDVHASAVPPHKPKAMAKIKKSISGNVLFLSITVAVIVGFVAGTQSNQIFSLIAPVFGVKTYTGELDLSSVQKTFQTLKANYDGTLNEASLVEGANKGMVSAAGDDYTLYMNAADSSAFNDDLTGNIGGGVGAEIGIRSENPTIIRVLKDNPAEKAGLLAGDTIVSVNDQATAGWTVEKTVGQIRGEVGTTVKLSILRGAEAKEFTVTRATITSPSVTSAVADGVGTLTISRFDDQTSTLARTAARDFKAQGVKSVIVDLRGNGGGYLTAAQEVAGLWLNDKVVVTERTDGKVTDTLRSGKDALLAGMPTVVLVDGGSASASEILAGALQDNGVAKLIGEKTFGKGSVQKLIQLPDGAQLKVTVAKWYTPKGKNITKEGITPDIAASITAENVNAGVDPQLDAAKKALGL